MVILLPFCASLATLIKHFLSCSKLLLGLPYLLYQMGDRCRSQLLLQVADTLKKAELKKIPRVYLVQETSDCVPGSLVTLAVEPP